jgi:DNA-binding transcriptional MerR regulator/uncharacterized glyoxalase superfamily protein PhnB
MSGSDEPWWKIGQVAARTGLTTRTLRYYEELGLLVPSGRLAGGHRVYTGVDLARLYRICLLRRLGVPLAEIRREVDDLVDRLADTVDRHVGEIDQRLAALGRHRERVVSIRSSLAAGSPSDQELLDVMQDMAATRDGLRQRLTLLVYDDIQAVHDHMVSVFGFGPGAISRDENGRVVHAELHVGDGVVWIHPPSVEYGLASPAQLGASTHCMTVMVDDVEAHHARAVAVGAAIEYPPRDMPYGVREYAARDPEGGLWSFMTPQP